MLAPQHDFPAFFREATGHAPRPWQAALAAEARPAHRTIRIPTGFGKTLGVALTWLYHRVRRNDDAWPTRLVWVLPMRTLVEQTRDVVAAALAQLKLTADDVSVEVLMGGANAKDWHLYPERPTIIIGTQDMVLSRAVNRGYGAARARWPMEFGLLSQDVLWVLDEVQLMGVGFATALQLAAFREAACKLRPTYLWAMSATLQEAWFSTSPDTRALTDSLCHSGLDVDDHRVPLWSTSAKPIEVLESGLSHSALAKRILEVHATIDAPAPLTLVVCNTVDRARELYDGLVKQTAKSDITVHLIHSRFRGFERQAWATHLLGEQNHTNRIFVATQVVEAGVDLSAHALFTELCPFPSLVQRLGRLARRGGEGPAVVIGLDPDKQAAPYDSDELAATLSALDILKDGSSRAISAFEAASPGLIADLYPYEPSHLLLREEIEELFDTTADLSGGDVDVSRYIRDGDERDLLVAWIPLQRDERGRPVAPPKDQRPPREALCAVPFQTARDWLCGKKSGTSVPKRLRKGVTAFVWSFNDGAWRIAERDDLYPGVTVIVDVEVGGYDVLRGFDANHTAPVPAVPFVSADTQDQADASWDDDALSQLTAWQTIAFHGASVASEVARMSEAGLIRTLPAHLLRLVDIAARWHDLGKSHPAFQAAITSGTRPARTDLAKAPKSAWKRGREIYGTDDDKRPGLRHELASTLALFDVLHRHAPLSHPSRLGAWAVGTPDTASSATLPNALEREILELSAEDFDLVAFLVCAHHGKLRTRLHMGPSDPIRADGPSPIRGIHEGDSLPVTALAGPDGTYHDLPESHLTLAPAVLGLSDVTGRSWSDRVEALRRRHGPFTLAYLECLLRAADIRASKATDLVDPALNGIPTEVA